MVTRMQTTRVDGQSLWLPPALNLARNFIELVVARRGSIPFEILKLEFPATLGLSLIRFLGSVVVMMRDRFAVVSCAGCQTRFVSYVF